MADKLKKKPSFFSLKRFNSQKSVNEPTTPSTMNNPPFSKPAQSSKVNPPETRLRNSQNITIPTIHDIRRRPRESAGGIKDLVQCSLCLEILANPKMLPCQHTFCCACLKVYVADQPIIDCPICRTRIHVLKSNFVDELPSNLYIDTLLTMFGVEEKTEVNTPPTSPYTNLQSVDLFAGGVRCSQCRSMCDNSDISCCAHCKLNFCRVCWSQHLKDMQTQIGSILKELDAASNRLNHKIEHYKDRCEHIVEQINIAVEEKINGILETKINLLKEAATIQKSGDLSALALKSSMDEARSVSLQAMANKENNDKNMVETFINLHQNTIQLLSEVSKWDLEKYVFDKESLSIESDSSMPYDAESDEPLPEAARQFDPMESEGSLILHYRSRKFIPHYSWRKTSRPCGVGVGPWNNHLYICGMDSHSVLVVERSQGKIVTRLSCQDMLCPVHIAFMKSLGEIYVTDKWKHCVHVFSKDGVYLRAFGQKGSRVGMFRSPEGIATDNDSSHIYVVDTGNDRVQVLDSEGKFLDQFGVTKKPQTLNAASIWTQQESLCTELNAPTAVAIVKDRVIILDSGNRRVKIYNKQDKNKITEFGSLGQRKGQFRQPEVLAVDPMGFILVGDSGNCRVQVFKPNGQLVRVFGGLGAEPGKFGWISGIHVTKQLDIIVSDTKNHNVNFF